MDSPFDLFRLNVQLVFIIIIFFSIVNSAMNIIGIAVQPFSSHSFLSLGLIIILQLLIVAAESGGYAKAAS